ncbi:MAG: phage major capsid protein [Clostridia bacterium]|nr:phage major capsid protein [Clostridia bacterium]
MDDEEALIYTKQQQILCHSEDHEEEDSEEDNDITNAEEEDSEEDMEEEDMSKKGTIDVQAVIDSMTDEQRRVLEAMYEQGQLDILSELENEDEEEEEYEEEDELEDEDEVEDEDEDDEDYDESDEDEDEIDDEYEDDDEDYDEEEEYEEAEAMAHSEIGGNKPMKRNVFDGTMDETNEQGATLTHSEIQTIFADAAKERMGSLKASVLAHAEEYGIEQIDWLFPDAKNLNNPPDFIHRDMGWVSKVMQGTRHTPFSRIKTMFADITADEARAKGYIKGNRKIDEVFTLLKRTTDPQTIYKKQKLDRDDVIDITDFDVVAWLKGEMRMMLDEEIARAILIGDGRQTSSDDKISESHVRSIFRDDDLYVVRKNLVAVQGEAKAKTFIKTVRKAWKDYKGSGNAVAFVTEDWLSELLLLEDGIGHFLYPTKETAANVLGVREIITVPVMADASTVRNDSVSGKSFKPAAIILNLNDYNVGADKGGSVNMFEDFDIDYNQQKYLIETRCSGALVKPYSAIVIEEEVNP